MNIFCLRTYEDRFPYRVQQIYFSDPPKGYVITCAMRFFGLTYYHSDVHVSKRSKSDNFSSYSTMMMNVIEESPLVSYNVSLTLLQYKSIRMLFYLSKSN